MQAITENTSKYFKAPREKVIFYRCAVVYIFALYIMPQYFGIPNPVFDLTAVRIMIIVLLGLIVCDYGRFRSFNSLFLKEKAAIALLPYLFVLAYTMFFRADINAFLNPFIELLEMFLMVYVIKDSLGTDKVIKMVTAFIYALVILGIIEFFIKVSPFSFMVNLEGVYTGVFIRGGHYRVMSNCVHSLGYGLLLTTAMPFSGYDVKNGEYNILRRPLLLIGIIVNIFMTGSRSTLGIMFLELFLMFVISEKKYLKNNTLILTACVVSFALFTFLAQKTSIGNYILLQLTSVIDSIFDTKLAENFGSSSTSMSSSTAYRHYLYNIFSVSWLNPIVGIGRKRSFHAMVNGVLIRSVDNFYIAEYIRYAYPGMIAYIFFLLFMLGSMLRDIFITKSSLIKALFVGAFCYVMHLTVVDSLQTLKYLYVLFAIYICCDKEKKLPEVEETSLYRGKRKSKYARK